MCGLCPWNPSAVTISRTQASSVFASNEADTNLEHTQGKENVSPTPTPIPDIEIQSAVTLSSGGDPVPDPTIHLNTTQELALPLSPGLNAPFSPASGVETSLPSTSDLHDILEETVASSFPWPAPTATATSSASLTSTAPGVELLQEVTSTLINRTTEPSSTASLSIPESDIGPRLSERFSRKPSLKERNYR